MKVIVVDVDGTICPKKTPEQDYADLPVFPDMVEKLRDLKADGWRIIMHTSRNMRSFKNSVGEINAKTLPVLIKWLEKHDVPFDEIHVGKPWCGHEGFYIDDRAIRPSEFRDLSMDEIGELLEAERRDS
ncbi:MULTISPECIES: hypothetical protein [Roseobacteraceae]|uniref:hypothetical protein n=1 Tax=Roseobacteraceae TaxID=2854170 RepID=UPI0007D906B1|nr:capsular biosynthesis protein [Roseovarius indicus]